MERGQARAHVILFCAGLTKQTPENWAPVRLREEQFYLKDRNWKAAQTREVNDPKGQGNTAIKPDPEMGKGWGPERERDRQAGGPGWAGEDQPRAGRDVKHSHDKRRRNRIYGERSSETKKADRCEPAWLETEFILLGRHLIQFSPFFLSPPSPGPDSKEGPAAPASVVPALRPSGQRPDTAAGHRTP